MREAAGVGNDTRASRSQQDQMRVLLVIGIVALALLLTMLVIGVLMNQDRDTPPGDQSARGSVEPPSRS
jgi:hypothetical protein